MSKLCLKCNEKIPLNIVINGKQRNLQNRKYCLKCSPFNVHNTKQLHCEVLEGKGLFKRYESMSVEEKLEYNKKIYNYQRIKRFELKQELIKLKGGCCQSCGYNRNFAALSFHHLNPDTKLFEIDARSLISKSKELILTEVSKCKLLCMNCHQELHHPSFNNTMVVPVGLEPTTPPL